MPCRRLCRLPAMSRMARQEPLHATGLLQVQHRVASQKAMRPAPAGTAAAIAAAARCSGSASRRRCCCCSGCCGRPGCCGWLRCCCGGGGGGGGGCGAKWRRRRRLAASSSALQRLRGAVVHVSHFAISPDPIDLMLQSEPQLAACSMEQLVQNTPGMLGDVPGFRSGASATRHVQLHGNDSNAPVRRLDTSSSSLRPKALLPRFAAASTLPTACRSASTRRRTCGLKVVKNSNAFHNSSASVTSGAAQQGLCAVQNMRSTVAAPKRFAEQIKCNHTRR